MVKQKYNVTGMTCSACSAHVEKAVNKLEGVRRAEVSLMTNSMNVEYDEAALAPESIIQAVVQAGYGASLPQRAGEKAVPARPEARMEEELSAIKHRLIWSFVFLIPLFYISMGHMMGAPLPPFLTGVENAVAFGLTQLLLTLPIASRDGQSAGFFTGLFTATSSTCVTGLILVDTWTQWTLFGQAVILTMIQLGGLGFMTVITLVSFALHRRIGLSERLIMVSTLNLNDMDGVVRVVRHALIGTFAMETAGAVLMSVCLIPEFGFLKGSWHAVFHAVSSFCNAGFALLGGRFGAFSSLAGYNDNPLMLGTTAALIVVGGLGFFVWEDIVDKRCWSRLSVYSKMVLLITAVKI